MVAPLPSRVSLSTEGPPFFGRVQQEGYPLLLVYCVCTKPHRIIVSRRGRGNLDSSFVFSPPPLLLMSALSGQRARATGPPSPILPTRHHCLFRTRGFLPEPNRRISRPRGRPYVTHFPTGVDDRSVAEGVRPRHPHVSEEVPLRSGSLCACVVPSLPAASDMRPSADANTLMRPPILPLHSCSFPPRLIIIFLL